MNCIVYIPGSIEAMKQSLLKDISEKWSNDFDDMRSYREFLQDSIPDIKITVTEKFIEFESEEEMTAFILKYL